MPRTVFALLAVSILLPSIAAAAPCPSDTLWVTDNLDPPAGSLVTTDAARSLTLDDTFQSISRYQSAYFDLSAGRIGATTTVYSGDYCNAEAVVSTHDVFTLAGPASAIPIAFQVNLAVTASRAETCEGLDHPVCAVPSFAKATLREGTSAPQSFTLGYSDATAVLTVNVARLPGETFTLQMFCEAVSATYPNVDALRTTASIDGVLSVTGLPPGYALFSCQGFEAGGVVPARRASWGGVKTIYR